jgi:hypothetical protein
MKPISAQRVALAAAALLLVANIVVPLVWGDVYPFTSAPMFRDAPRFCCNYRIYDSAGRELPPENWLVHRLYDGNPLGYGVGISPPPILEQQFGAECDQAAALAHIQKQFSRPENREFTAVEVVQEVIGPIDTQHIGILRTDRWVIARQKH